MCCVTHFLTKPSLSATNNSAEVTSISVNTQSTVAAYGELNYCTLLVNNKSTLQIISDHNIFKRWPHSDNSKSD